MTCTWSGLARLAVGSHALEHEQQRRMRGSRRTGNSTYRPLSARRISRCPDRGESPALTNYKVCVGDDYHQNHFRPDQSSRYNRGIFQIERWVDMAAITDGTSNTVMIGETAGGGDRSRCHRRRRGQHAGLGSGPLPGPRGRDRQTADGPVRAQFRPHTGRAWDGRPYFVGCGDDRGSRTVQLATGAVWTATSTWARSPATIRAGHTSPLPTARRPSSMTASTPATSRSSTSTNPGSRESPWGTWGALGSMSGHESVSMSTLNLQ